MKIMSIVLYKLVNDSILPMGIVFAITILQQVAAIYCVIVNYKFSYECTLSLIKQIPIPNRHLM